MMSSTQKTQPHATTDPNERMRLVREELRRRQKKEKDEGVPPRQRRYSWRKLEKEIGHSSGAIRNFLGNDSDPGSEDHRARYDAWGVREGVLAPLPDMDPERPRLAVHYGRNGAANDALQELRRRCDAIDRRTDLTPLQREMAKEREAQMHRQAVLEEETRIAGQRMRVIGEEVEIAKTRGERMGTDAQPISAELTTQMYERLIIALSEEADRRRASNRESDA